MIFKFNHVVVFIWIITINMFQNFYLNISRIPFSNVFPIDHFDSNGLSILQIKSFDYFTKCTLANLIFKGGLISESLSLTLQSPQNVPLGPT